MKLQNVEDSYKIIEAKVFGTTDCKICGKPVRLEPGVEGVFQVSDSDARMCGKGRA